MRVHKFGGTSVGNAGHIARVVEIIVRAHQEETLASIDPDTLPPGTVVVVSAMSGVISTVP